jgi:hypothetical protein
LATFEGGKTFKKNLTFEQALVGYYDVEKERGKRKKEPLLLNTEAGHFRKRRATSRNSILT